MDAKEDDQEGVEPAQRGGKGEQAGDDRGYVGGVPLDQAGSETGDQADQRADGEINFAGEDDASLSDGDKSEPRDLKHPDGRWFNLEETAIFAAAKLAEIKAAAAGAPRVEAPRKARKSVGDLVDGYLNSLRFSQLSPDTRRSYGYYADWVHWECQSRADRLAGVARVVDPLSLAPAAIITRRDVNGWHDKLAKAHGVGQARNVITFLSACYKWGVKAQGWEEIGDQNLCTQLQLPRNPPRVKVWSVAAIKAMIATADAAGRPSLGDAMIIALYSAQRQTDIVELVDKVGKTSIAARAAAGRPLLFRQRKTGAGVGVFAAPDLVARLAAAEARRAAAKIVAMRGEPRSSSTSKPGSPGSAAPSSRTSSR